MATIIEALFVTIGLDPKLFKKGAKEVQDSLDKTGKAAAKPSKALKDAGDKGAAAMGKFRNELMRTTAALIGLGAIKQFVASVTQSDAALGRMATNAGTSVETLSAWKLAADSAGSSGDSFAGSLNGIVQAVTRFSMTGEGGESLKYFRSLGISLTDASGKMRDLSTIAMESSSKLSAMSPAQAQVMGRGMGYSESDVNFLRQGPAAVKAFYDEAAKANTRTPEDVKNAMDRQKAWALLRATFSRLATTLLNVVSPALVGLMNIIRNHAGVAAALLGSVALALTAMSVVRFAGLISQLTKVAAAMRGVGLAAEVTAAGGAAGAAGAFGKGLVGKLGVAGAAVGTGVELWGLGSALKDWWDISHREGVQLSAYTKAGLAGRLASAPSGAGTGGGGGSTPEKAAYLSALEKQFKLPAGLLDSVWLQESQRGNPKWMTSPAGAKGHFGQMDKTAAAYGVLDPNDFGQSAMGAARMFADLLRQYKGSLPMALAAYNDGSGNLAKRGMGNLPLETARYIPSVMSRMPGGGMGGGGNTTTVHIDAIHTQATDAKGIARELPAAIQNQQFALQANTGPQ